MESKLFTPVTFGPLTLRNRTIRSAAFESMCPGNAPSQMLLDYHRSVAAGGVGMTTVAYAAVTQSGLSFDRQLWLRPEIISGLREVTGAIHTEGAAAGIQIGHCGNMSHKKICGTTPISASTGFNLYSPTFVRGMKREELPEMARAYGRAVHLAREAGFDAVEVERLLLLGRDRAKRVRDDVLHVGLAALAGDDEFLHAHDAAHFVRKADALGLGRHQNVHFGKALDEFGRNALHEFGVGKAHEAREGEVVGHLHIGEFALQAENFKVEVFHGDHPDEERTAGGAVGGGKECDSLADADRARAFLFRAGRLF